MARKAIPFKAVSGPETPESRAALEAEIPRLWADPESRAREAQARRWIKQREKEEREHPFQLPRRVISAKVRSLYALQMRDEPYQKTPNFLIGGDVGLAFDGEEFLQDGFWNEEYKRYVFWREFARRYYDASEVLQLAIRLEAQHAFSCRIESHPLYAYYPEGAWKDVREANRMAGWFTKIVNKVMGKQFEKVTLIDLIGLGLIPPGMLYTVNGLCFWHWNDFYPRLYVMLGRARAERKRR